MKVFDLNIILPFCLQIMPFVCPYQIKNEIQKTETKFKTESSLWNDKIKSSNKSNEWIKSAILMLLLTLYRNFLCRKWWIEPDFIVVKPLTFMTVHKKTIKLWEQNKQTMFCYLIVSVLCLIKKIGHHLTTITLIRSNLMHCTSSSYSLLFLWQANCRV